VILDFFVKRSFTNGANVAVNIARFVLCNIPKITIKPVSEYTPVLTAYKFIETAKPGTYALGASSKGDDYKRIQEFTSQHQKNGKYYHLVPKGVKVVELIENIEPLKYSHPSRKDIPISATILRNDILEKNFKNFSLNYPYQDIDTINFIWNSIRIVCYESN